jgi:hypothetical protein
VGPTLRLFRVRLLQHGLASAGKWFLTQLGCAAGVLTGIYVTTPRGVTYKIPEGWTRRTADNGKGIVFQKPGSSGNQNMIRIMGPNSQNPNGYVRIFNSKGEPVNYNLKPGTKAETHIPEDEEGPFADLPIEP